MRESLIFYQSFARAIKKLPESEQLKALWSIIDYALEDKEPDGDGMYMVVYEMAKPQIDANVERKRNGSRGGRPPKPPEKPVESVKKKELPLYQEIIDYLNEKTEKNFKVTDEAKTYIDDRTNDGYTLSDFQTVIKKKVAEWKGTKMDKFLRPETLFGTKFDSYLNQNEIARKKAKSTGFSNFEERNYDFEELERELLGAQEGGS